MASSDFRQALSLLDDHTQAAVRAAVELSDPRRLRTQVLRSEVYAVLGRNDESVRIADQVLEPARALGDDVLIGSSLKVLGVATQRSGHTHGALELLRDALQHFRRADAKEHEALTLLALAGLTRHVGWWEEGEAHAREALSIGEQLDGPRLQAGAHFFLGALSVQQGSLVDAERHYRAAAGLHETAGYRLGVANCTNALGNLARSAGRFEEAERSFRQAIELHKSIGSGQDIGPMMSLALSHIDTGDFGAARAILEAGCARFRERNQNNLLGCALACLLPCLANAEEWSRWDRTLSEARTLLEETGILSEDVARPAEVGAEFALKAGHPGRAKEAYEIAMRQWMGLGRDERVGALMKAMEPLL
jgi:tetratricopeptide (TPR) repeat protein